MLSPPLTRAQLFFRLAAQGIALYLLAVSWLPHTLFSRFSEISTLQGMLPALSPTTDAVIIVALICLAVLLFRKKIATIAQKSLATAILTYLCACIVTVMSAQQDLLTLIRATSIATAVLIGVIAAGLMANVRSGMRLAIAVVLVQALYTFALYMSSIGVLWSGNVPRATGTFQDTSTTATLLAAFLPLCILACLQISDQKLLYRIVATSLLGASLTLTWLRTSFAAVGIGTALIAFRARATSKLMVILIAMLVSLTLVTYAKRASGETNELATERSNESRILAWKSGLAIFSRRAISGTGIGAVDIPVVAPGPSPRTVYLPEPKSVYILLLDELGVGGGLLVIVLCASLASTFSRARGLYSEGVLGAWVVLGVLGIFDSAVLSNRFGSNVLFGFLVGLTITTDFLASAIAAPNSDGSSTRATRVLDSFQEVGAQAQP